MSFFLILLLMSIDNLIVSITYNNSKIKIPIKSKITICLTNIFILLILYIIGYHFNLVTNEFISNFLSFIFLIILGLYNIFNDYMQDKVSDNSTMRKIFKNKLNADFDNSKYLNFKESICLGFILSIDTIIGGFSIILENINIVYLCIISFLINFIFISLGKYINIISSKLNIDVYVGIFIIFIAILKFIFNIYA